MVSASLAGLAEAIPAGGYLVYTGQPWHPQLELIARALTSHRSGQAWIMRRRTQAEMDQLVAAAGFRKIEAACATAVAIFARLITGVRGEWRGCAPDPRPRIYFANHRSHADFVLIWTVLPAPLRRVTRPVAGADYWLKNGPRRFFGERVFRAVLIDRNPVTRDSDPIAIMAAALDQKSSLILFPEGTRNMGEEPLLPFKSGLYHLARARPDVELVPIWIENLNRVMPKGEFVPIPLLCTVTVGAPIILGAGEDKGAFLDRCRNSLLALSTRSRDDG
jgi:1-acyl-sn-glycerol-3-phosphate acyltransferase